MRLVYTCSSCKRKNYFKPKMESRAILQMKYGDEVRVNCNHCGKQEKKHLNKIRATVDNRLIIGGLVTGILIVVFLIGSFGILAIEGIAIWKAFAASGSTIAGIPIFLWNKENKAVRDFNRYAIKR